MEDRFLKIEKEFEKLKKRYWLQEISQQEFKEELKKLQVRDSEGRLWMIGSRSGRWYYFDGRNWIRSEPRYDEGIKKICRHCGFENRAESRSCIRCGELLDQDEERQAEKCPVCGEMLDPATGECSACAAKDREKFTQKEEGKKPEKQTAKDEQWLLIRRFHPVSFMLFLGGIGIVAGVVMGAVCGTTSYTFGLEKHIPLFMSAFQGNLLGGIIYGASGSILGFILFASAGLLFVLIFNLVVYFTGGIRMRIRRTNS